MKKIGIIQAHRHLIERVREKRGPAAISLLEFLRTRKGGGK